MPEIRPQSPRWALPLFVAAGAVSGFAHPCLLRHAGIALFVTFGVLFPTCIAVAAVRGTLKRDLKFAAAAGLFSWLIANCVAAPNARYAVSALIMCVPLLLLLYLVYCVLIDNVGAERAPLPGVCPTCGYDVRATFERRCPECGSKL